ncbi:minor capsid protein [Clostridium perfringens]|nr:minor capsid protein [Clostridium perfringens]
MVGHQVYALSFPEYSEDEAVKLEITSGVQEAGGVDDFNIQLIVRASHPARTEKICIDIIENLDKKTNRIFDSGKCQMILAKAEAPQPYYMGQAENGAFLMSVDFRLLTTTLT